MSWNYRVIYAQIPTDNRPDSEWYVGEVYYDEETGEPCNWSGGIAISGETYEELCRDLANYNGALLKPSLCEMLVGGDLTLVEMKTGEK